uniref:GBF-interacting protein 1 N-terminal domain-containing protein n=1 Tax=Noccaea caerulescens TaxID=107243 RepID=A0A1J3DEU8_NOCCA
MSSKVSIGGGGGGSAGARKGNNGIHDIPSGSRKIVQSLKEIVNSPEAEIYAMLKECNMDPNEAVNRLLSQDPFHEVKSKKEKKKETRDIPDSRLRGANNTYNRGVRGGSDRYAGRSGSTHFSSTDSGNFQGKPTNKKESGTQGYTGSWSSSPASGVANHHQTQTPHSESVVMEHKLPSVASGDGISTSQSASGHQTAWFGASGQRSMADIVKMGRPQNKTTQQNVNMRSEINHAHEGNVNQQVPVKDEWPSIEKPQAPSMSSASVAPAESEVFNGQADFQSDRVDQHLQDRLENIHLSENSPAVNIGVDRAQPDSVAGGNVQEEVGEYQTQSHPLEYHKDEDDVSSGSANFQQLTIDSHDQEAPHEEDRPAVVIPDHLLIHTEECSQLSFGSFGGFGPRPLSNNVEETSEVAPQMEHSDARNTEFYGDEHLGSTANEDMVHAPSSGNYDDSLESRQEVLKQENSETTQEHQYTFAQSEPEYAYENAKQQLDTAYDDASQTNAQNQMQNLASLSNVMGYTHSVPNTLLAQTAQNARELEFQYSPFPVAQSMQSRNINNASSLGGQSISMPEALRGSGIPATQQTLPGANIATGPALPQQLPMHAYSQPTMPLAHFANMIGYPLMPQNYPYMPSAFQQTYAGNSSYHQQLAAALLPQYKTNLSPSNLPQSATAPASAYGFGNPANVGSAGNFPLNQQSAPTSTTLGYEDVLSSQYKESNHLLALQQQQQQQQQQNENSAMWHHGHGSRTMSGVPANTYYNLQAQQQQQHQQQQQAQQAAGGYRQAQQQQHYGSHGYPNFYQAQTEMSLERQQQNPRDGTGSQVGQPSNQTQQLWQNSY